jgi:hypothetical protein
MPCGNAACFATTDIRIPTTSERFTSIEESSGSIRPYYFVISAYYLEGLGRSVETIPY